MLTIVLRFMLVGLPIGGFAFPVVRTLLESHAGATYFPASMADLGSDALGFLVTGTFDTLMAFIAVGVPAALTGVAYWATLRLIHGRHIRASARLALGAAIGAVCLAPWAALFDPRYSSVPGNGTPVACWYISGALGGAAAALSLRQRRFTHASRDSAES